MTSKILVTGASGTVGREVVKALRNAGQEVMAAVPDQHKAAARLDSGAPVVRLDFGDPTTYAGAFDGVDRLFLMRPPAIADVKRYLFPVIEHAARAGVRHIVFLSLMGVNPLTPHYRVERRLQSSGIPYTFLRPSFFMQNLDTFYRQGIRDDNCIFLPAGHGKTSFIDVRDIASVAAVVMTQPGHENRAYTLTGSEALDYYRIADLFSAALGRRITYANPSPWDYRRQMKARGIDNAFIRVMLGLYFTVRIGQGAKVTDEVQRLLQRPPIRVTRYIQDYAWAWQPGPAGSS